MIALLVPGKDDRRGHSERRIRWSHVFERMPRLSPPSAADRDGDLRQKEVFDARSKFGPVVEAKVPDVLARGDGAGDAATEILVSDAEGVHVECKGWDGADGNAGAGDRREIARYIIEENSLR